MKDKMKSFFHDLGLSALIGLSAGGVLSGVLFIAGALLRHFQPREGLVFVRGGLLVTGALGLFVCAGLLIRPRKGEKLRENPQWTQRFRLFGLMPVVGTAAIVLLALASAVDYILHF